jgi:hypothetical protein
MKYVFTTLAINEPYFKKSLDFFMALHNQTINGFYNITTSNNDLELTRSRLPLEMQNKMTIAFTKFGNKYPEFKEEMQKGKLYLYKEGDQAQLAAYRELLRQSTGIVADKLYIFPMVASTEKG